MKDECSLLYSCTASTDHLHVQFLDSFLLALTVLQLNITLSVVRLRRINVVPVLIQGYRSAGIFHETSPSEIVNLMYNLVLAFST